MIARLLCRVLSHRFVIGAYSRNDLGCLVADAVCTRCGVTRLAL